MPAPAECRTKEEVRAEIDRLDRELVQLLGERFAYVRRMAEMKNSPAEADDPARIDEVLARVETEARAAGLDADLIRALWQRLIDWNVAWERGAIGAGDDG
jgi:isochorismate pyruvate lyase